MVNMTRQPDIYEVFEKFEKVSKRADRIKILRQYDTAALKDVCRGMFDDSIQWNLPDGKPPYKATLPESTPSNLLKQNRQFAYLAKGGPGDKMPSFKRESLFIGVLESIHPQDAEIVIAMVNKKSPIKGLTKKLVQEAYPDLIRV